MKRTIAFLFCSLLFSIPTFTGCSLKRAIEPPPKKGFIEYRHDAGEQTAKFPFAYTWLNPELSERHYSKVQIAPIDTSFIGDVDWKRSLGTVLLKRTQFDQYVAELAEYFRETLTNAFRDPRNNRFSPSEHPEEGTVRLEIALTEVVFEDPLVYAGTFAIPLPATSYAFDTVKSPMLSKEARIVDAITGELLATFADRKFPQVKPLDLNKFTVVSPTREIVDRWTDEIVRSFNRRGDEKVQQTLPFSLVPW